VTTPDDMVDCQGGQITIAGRVIHDNQGEHYGVIPVHKALEVSSDVGAIKMALKVGQDNFYDYVHQFGFGSRTGIELPGETRGLLRPVNKWGSSSIGSIAMGQEVGVTPLQLVSMVSTIANGGTYLPPHVLMPAQTTTGPHGEAVLQPMPFKTDGELPNPLPAGAHRVLSEMAAAQMRKMMEGVVLYGTGKPAILNGYSSGGKTGTAQKIDPATHTYSKTMHIASFAGIAPVNNPVISVAVVIDNPHGGSYYGTAVSAPVFADVAQQVLEYLGVPHDTDLHAPTGKKLPPVQIAEDDEHDQGGDVNAMFAAINDLPSDDPLRAAPAPVAAAPAPPAEKAASTQTAGTKSSGAQNVAAVEQAAAPDRNAQPSGNAVTVSDARKLKVPSLLGLPMRQVITQAAAAGLEVQIAGSGTVREQAPAAGTMVAAGTQIVVRCSR
jgi:cell division protein FtsI (penicillin-binding protein 3)